MKKLLTALVAAALGAASATADIRAVTPKPRDGGKPEKATMKRHAKAVDTARKGGAKLVFIGDSITHFWSSKGASVLRRNFSKGDWRMFNLGTSGDHTENVIWRLENGELDGFNAKCVHVMIGTNNTGHNSFEKEPPSDTILGIRRILQIVREKQPSAKIILTAIFPRGEKATDARRVRNDVVNAEIARFCDGKTVLWCDFRDRFLKADGTLPSELVPGFLHPAKSGYQIWADSVKPFVEYCLTGRGNPPVSPAAADPRPGCDPDTRPRAARPVTRIDRLTGDASWADRLLADRNMIVKTKRFKTVFLGDTKKDGLGRTLDEVRGLSSPDALDLGYEGDRVENVLWRAMYGELEGYKADCFVVSAGAANSDDAPEDVAAGVRRILATVAAKHSGAEVILLSVPSKAYGAAGVSKVRRLNALLKKLADGASARWIERR